MATRTTCDKCHREIPARAKIYTVTVAVQSREMHPAAQASPALRIVDCCEACANQILEPYPPNPVLRAP